MRSKKLTRKSLDEYFKMLDEIDSIHWKLIQMLEKTMQRDTGIKDLEFVWGEFGLSGIGTPTRKKKIPLIHR